MSNYYSDKIVIITGGSRGIGKGLVEAYARENCKTYFTYLSSVSNAQKIEDDLQEEGLFVKGMQVDGRNEGDVKEFISRVVDEHNKVDILVNNAGYIPRGLFLNTTKGIWDKTIDTNLNGVFNYCQEVLKHMMLKKEGVILNISSVSALHPGKGQAAYSASKAAIESLTKLLAMEYGKYNIRVNSIAPGLIETEVFKSITASIKGEILKKTPLNRFGIVEDVTNSALFLSSEKAEFITGIQLLVTGGRHLY